MSTTYEEIFTGIPGIKFDQKSECCGLIKLIYIYNIYIYKQHGVRLILISTDDKEEREI